MSNAGIFIFGFFITLVVFLALGILAYGISLEDKDLKTQRREREAAEAAEPPAIPLSPPRSRAGSAPGALPVRAESGDAEVAVAGPHTAA